MASDKGYNSSFQNKGPFERKLCKKGLLMFLNIDFSFGTKTSSMTTLQFEPNFFKSDVNDDTQKLFHYFVQIRYPIWLPHCIIVTMKKMLSANTAQFSNLGVSLS